LNSKKYDILLNPEAEKELNDLGEVSTRVREGLKRLSQDPKRSGSGRDVKKLSGTSDPELYRLRIGDYRAIYWVDEEKKEVLVEKISHRKKAYRDLSDLR